VAARNADRRATFDGRHCVYNISNNQWYSNLDVSLGQNGATKPTDTTCGVRSRSPVDPVAPARLRLRNDHPESGYRQFERLARYGWRTHAAYNVNINGYPATSRPERLACILQLQIIQTFRSTTPVIPSAV